MKSADINWRYLLSDTLLPLVTAGVAMVILFGSQCLSGAQTERYSRFSNDQSSMNEDYAALLYRKRLINRYFHRYELFHEQGFIGPESRLDWIETLRISASELGLPHLTYSIEPQLDVIAPVAMSNGENNIQIYLSRFDLEVGLVHESDLLRFVARLQSDAPGFVKVEQCSMTRQSSSGEWLPTSANVVASCALSMFSVITSDVPMDGASI